MRKYNIGLDFGTYQSKACVLNLQTEEHEFFTFPNGTFFLPSKVFLRDDGKLEYGNSKSSDIREGYSYFKIASAEDEEFHTETYDKKNIDSNSYHYNQFGSYTPEFLSVLYLTYVIQIIKEAYYGSAQRKVQKGGLISKFFQKEEKELRFTIKLGIPTEWSQNKNIKRKRKFENILLLSELLQKKYLTSTSFLDVTAEKLISDVQTIQGSYNFSDKKSFEDALNDIGISVYPETAAGLTFVVKTGQLIPGSYAIMDIGGGSSDISFFSVLSGYKIRYLASESYMMAANDVYRKFALNVDSITDLQQAEVKVRTLIVSNAWKNDDVLKGALNEVEENLDRIVYRLFNKRVYAFDRRILQKYNDQPIVLYGGGARLPILKEGKIKIHDNGGTMSILTNVTYLEKQGIGRNTSNIKILPNKRFWENDFALLVVALGLSFIHSPGDADWFTDESYRPNDITDSNLTSHPFNEGYFIFNVLARKF